MLIFRDAEKTSDCTYQYVPFAIIRKWQVKTYMLFRCYYLATVMPLFKEAKTSLMSLQFTILLEHQLFCLSCSCCHYCC